MRFGVWKWSRSICAFWRLVKAGSDWSLHTLSLLLAKVSLYSSSHVQNLKPSPVLLLCSSKVMIQAQGQLSGKGHQFYFWVTCWRWWDTDGCSNLFYLFPNCHSQFQCVLTLPLFMPIFLSVAGSTWFKANTRYRGDILYHQIPQLNKE